MENSRTKLPPSQSRRQSRNKLSLHVKEEDTSLSPSLFLFRKNEPLLPFFLPFSLSFIPKPSHLLLSFFFFSFLSIFTSLKVKEEETRRMNNFSRRVLLREIISSLLLGSFYRALSSFKGLWLGQPLQQAPILFIRISVIFRSFSLGKIDLIFSGIDWNDRLGCLFGETILLKINLSVTICEKQKFSSLPPFLPSLLPKFSLLNLPRNFALGILPHPLTILHY